MTLWVSTSIEIMAVPLLSIKEMSISGLVLIFISIIMPDLIFLNFAKFSV